MALNDLGSMGLGIASMQMDDEHVREVGEVGATPPGGAHYEDGDVLELSPEDDDLAERLMEAWWPQSKATLMATSSRPTSPPTTAPTTATKPTVSMASLTRKRVRQGSNAFHCIVSTPIDEGVEFVGDAGMLPQEATTRTSIAAMETTLAGGGKRTRVLEDMDNSRLFNMWLTMKAEQRHDSRLQALVDALILPEDLYHHFREFVPPGASQAETDRVYMRRLQYERECAERALAGCEPRSWLLRRSSLNRRSGVLRVAPLGVPSALGCGLHERVKFGPNDQQRPVFYAFSYSMPSGTGSDEPTIAHVLIMKWKNLWARCDCDDGVEITPTFFSSSFIAVLDKLLDSEGLRPERMVLGYIAAQE